MAGAADGDLLLLKGWKKCLGDKIIPKIVRIANSSTELELRVKIEMRNKNQTKSKEQWINCVEKFPPNCDIPINYVAPNGRHITHYTNVEITWPEEVCSDRNSDFVQTTWKVFPLPLGEVALNYDHRYAEYRQAGPNPLRVPPARWKSSWQSVDLRRLFSDPQIDIKSFTIEEKSDIPPFGLEEAALEFKMVKKSPHFSLDDLSKNYGTKKQQISLLNTLGEKTFLIGVDDDGVPIGVDLQIGYNEIDCVKNMFKMVEYFPPLNLEVSCTILPLKDTSLEDIDQTKLTYRISPCNGKMALSLLLLFKGNAFLEQCDDGSYTVYTWSVMQLQNINIELQKGQYRPVPVVTKAMNLDIANSLETRRIISITFQNRDVEEEEMVFVPRLGAIEVWLRWNHQPSSAILQQIRSPHYLSVLYCSQETSTLFMIKDKARIFHSPTNDVLKQKLYQTQGLLPLVIIDLSYWKINLQNTNWILPCLQKERSFNALIVVPFCNIQDSALYDDVHKIFNRLLPHASLIDIMVASEQFNMSEIPTSSLPIEQLKQQFQNWVLRSGYLSSELVPMLPRTQALQRIYKAAVTTSRRPLVCIPLLKTTRSCGASSYLAILNLMFREDNHNSILCPAGQDIKDINVNTIKNSAKIFVLRDDVPENHYNKDKEELFALIKQQKGKNMPQVIFIAVVHVSESSFLKGSTSSHIISPTLEEKDIDTFKEKLSSCFPENESYIESVATAAKSNKYDRILRHIFVFLLAATKGTAISPRNWINDIIKILIGHKMVYNTAICIALSTTLSYRDCVYSSDVQHVLRDVSEGPKKAFDTLFDYCAGNRAKSLHPFFAMLFLQSSCDFDFSRTIPFIDIGFWDYFTDLTTLSNLVSVDKPKFEDTLIKNFFIFRGKQGNKSRFSRLLTMIIYDKGSTVALRKDFLLSLHNLVPKGGLDQIPHANIAFSRAYREVISKTPTDLRTDANLSIELCELSLDLANLAEKQFSAVKNPTHTNMAGNNLAIGK